MIYICMYVYIYIVCMCVWCFATVLSLISCQLCHVFCHGPGSQRRLVCVGSLTHRIMFVKPFSENILVNQIHNSICDMIPCPLWLYDVQSTLSPIVRNLQIQTSWTTNTWLRHPQMWMSGNKTHNLPFSCSSQGWTCLYWSCVFEKHKLCFIIQNET